MQATTTQITLKLHTKYVETEEISTALWHILVEKFKVKTGSKLIVVCVNTGVCECFPSESIHLEIQRPQLVFHSTAKAEQKRSCKKIEIKHFI